MTSGARPLHAISAVIFAVSALYLVLMVLRSPIIGYGNNYDFIRQSGCTDLWQSYSDRPKEKSHQDSPVNALARVDAHREDLCLRSSDNIVPWLVARLHGTEDVIDFREVGGLRAALLLALVAWLLLSADDPRLRIALAVAFALIFTDFANLGYFNTLYLEFSVLGGTFLCVGVLCVLASARSAPRLGVYSLALVGLLWLALSKQQYGFLGPLLGACCSLVLFAKWPQRKLLSAAYALVCLGLLLALPMLNPVQEAQMMTSVDHANKMDTFLGAVLPAASDKDRALHILGLPAHCRDAIGNSWYERKHDADCPEVFDVSRSKLLGLFVRDPITLGRPIRKGLIAAGPFYPDHLGVFEDPTEASNVGFRWARGISLSRWLDVLPKGVFWRAAVASFCASGLLLAVLLLGGWRRVTRISPLGPAMIMWSTGGMVALYALASSVFGDGYYEINKHTVAFSTGVAFQLSGLLYAALILSDARRHRSPSPRTPLS